MVDDHIQGLQEHMAAMTRRHLLRHHRHHQRTSKRPTRKLIILMELQVRKCEALPEIFNLQSLSQKKADLNVDAGGLVGMDDVGCAPGHWVRG